MFQVFTDFFSLEIWSPFLTVLSRLNVVTGVYRIHPTIFQVNLCFDQFVYNLSDNIFNHFRQKACILYLDKKFKDDVTNLKIRYLI